MASSGYTKQLLLSMAPAGEQRTLGIVDHAIKVLDVPQAITAQLQGVGGEAQAVVHDIEGTLVLEGVAGVAIGHNDLHHGPSVHDGPDAATVFIPVISAVQCCAVCDQTPGMLRRADNL